MDKSNVVYCIKEKVNDTQDKFLIWFTIQNVYCLKTVPLFKNKNSYKLFKVLQIYLR